MLGCVADCLVTTEFTTGSTGSSNNVSSASLKRTFLHIVAALLNRELYSTFVSPILWVKYLRVRITSRTTFYVV